MLIFQGNFTPLKFRFENRIELINEIFIMLSSLHILLFTDYVPDMQT